MNTKIVIALLVVGVAALSMAQTPTYTAADAAKHVGEIATITGTVNGVRQAGKGNIFLSIGGKYTNKVFTAFIPSSSAADFSNPQQYEGKAVAVSGKITLYHGEPEIVLENVSQIIIK
jgi:DNA/RNA endonuclease YhcR with UshA esterase domain